MNFKDSSNLEWKTKSGGRNTEDALCVRLSTKVLDRVNKGLIQSIAFERKKILMALATLETSITYYYCIKRLCVRILIPVESLLYLH